MSECSIIGCDRPVVARGYCRKHYYNWREHGDPLFKKVENKCSECNRKHYAKGLCRECYFKAKGTVGGGKNLGWKTCTQGCEAPVYAKGLCRQCWNRLTHSGTLDAKKVADEPGEEWREINRPDCKDVFISNIGRVKSCRSRDERLLSSRMAKVNPKEQQLTLICSNGQGNNIHVHMEVLRAFRPNLDGDFQAVFIDGDRSNCRADNLRWYGREYLVAKAITMAESSDHPLADCFLKFWNGDHNALNNWFEQQRVWLGGYIRRRFDMFCVPYYVDVEDRAQETIVLAFLALRRGMIDNLYALKSWLKGIAKRALASGIRDLLPTVGIEQEYDGDTYSVADVAGWCHPSAELEAIYREEVLCAG